MKLDPTMPLFFSLVYLVSTCALSVLLCWITLGSDSGWPASTGHGVINQISVLPKPMLNGPALLLLGTGNFGLVDGLGYLVLARGLLWEKEAGGF